MVKEDLSGYVTVSGLLESYKSYMGCKGDLKGLVEKVNSIRDKKGMKGKVSVSTVKKWSAGISSVPNLDNLLKLFIVPEYAERIQKIHRRLQKERKYENAQKKLMKEAPEAEDTQTVNLSVEVSDEGYPEPPCKERMDESTYNKSLSRYKAEKSLRAYNESSYIRTMNLTEEEVKGIEDLLKILFDGREISVFRYSVCFLMSSYPFVDAMCMRSKAKTVRDIIDRYLFYMSDSVTHYMDIRGIVESYKKWRGLSARYDNSNPPQLLTVEDYKKVLRLSAPDFERIEYILNPLNYKYLQKLSLADLYNVCKIASKWDNKPVRAYSNTDNTNIISSEGLSYNDCKNQLPYSVKNYAYIGHGDWGMPSTYLAILDRLVVKKENSFPYTKTKKVLFINKNEGIGKVYEISLELTPLGKEFIKWYEKFFEGTGYFSHQTLTVAGKEDIKMDTMEKAFADKKDFDRFREKYTDKKGNNILFSKNLAMTADRKVSHRTNNNLVIGSTGTGKDWGYIKPNLAQDNASRILVDSTDENFNTFAPYLIEQGCMVYHLNLCNPLLSNHYNPLQYVCSEDGTVCEMKVDNLVNTFTDFVFGDQCDPIYKKVAKALISMLICYLFENNCSFDEKNFSYISYMIKNTDFEADIKSFITAQKEKGNTVKTKIWYDMWSLAPKHLRNNIIMCVRVSLSVFSLPAVDRITRTNVLYRDMNIDFDELAKTKTYLFVTIPHTDKNYQLITTLFFSQLINRLYELGDQTLVNKWCVYKSKGIPAVYPFDTEKEAEAFKSEVTVENIVRLPYMNDTEIYYLVYGDKVYKKSFSRTALERLVEDIKGYNIENTNPPSLPMEVDFMFNEFGFYKIPSIEVLLATSHHYRIGVHLIVQSIGQIINLYGDDYKTILANIITSLFLGSPISRDIEYIQKCIGKTTITTKRGKKKVVEEKYLVSEKTIDLLSRQKKAVVSVRDMTPFVDDRLSFSEHPCYEAIMKAKDTTQVEPYFRLSPS